VSGEYLPITINQLFKHKAGILPSWAEVFAYPEQLIVLADSIRSAERAGLYLADACGNGQVGDCRIFCFAASVAYDGCPAGPLRHIDRLECFGERAYLVELYQYRVGTVKLYTFSKAFGVGYK